MQRTGVRLSSHRARGFSLVEVLISIIVLSFGMLGMVGMQAAALQANREARLQSVAYQLAQELSEMMRGNKDVGLLATGNPYLGDFRNTLAPVTANYCMTAENSSSSNGNCAGVAIADQTAIAQAQMTEWLARAEQELSGARVVVCFDSEPYDADGLPQWDCTAAAASATAQPFIKIGWTLRSTNSAASPASALVRTGSRESRPSLAFPVIAGRANNT